MEDLPAAERRGLVQIARAVAKLTGGEPSATCPLACLMAADPWVVEITEASLFMGESFNLDAFVVATGREPTQADRDAWTAYRRATNDALRARMDEARAKAERQKADEKNRKGHR